LTPLQIGGVSHPFFFPLQPQTRRLHQSRQVLGLLLHGFLADHLQREEVLFNRLQRVFQQ